jgi:hypothetical protein
MGTRWSGKVENRKGRTMKKFLMNGTFISVLFSVFGLIKTTMTGKRDWKLILLWASWVLSLIAVIATINDPDADDELDDF